MQPSPVSALPAAFSDRERVALLNLLCDDDPGVQRAVRAKIISQGAMAAAWMRSFALDSDPVLRRRSQEIVRHFDSQAADNRFLGFCLKNGEDLDLEEGALLLAVSEYPHINLAGYRAWLDDLAAQFREHLGAETDPDIVLAIINRHLFSELGFVGNEKNYYDPQNSYLNRVLDRRTGNPITLSLVYLLIARRLRLPVVGIGMPGHFVCRFQSALREIYIDPFNRGRLLSKADCLKYLADSGQAVHDPHLSPVTPRRMLTRICLNLHHIYVRSGQMENAARFQRYLIALSN
ncbi:MAG: hypothetical protein HY301_19640 [Verrucomicrobia bacterium]|nr:hypothetical protein [Verrucomicrobiota bacterium]